MGEQERMAHGPGLFHAHRRGGRCSPREGRGRALL